MIYECASALVALSTSTTAIRAAANSYTSLLTAQSDNNIKLIVLERLQDLKRQHLKVLQEMVMDILRSLSSANMDIRKKTLDITLELLVPNKVGDVMQVLKKEVMKTGGEDGGDKITEYRAMLISAIHKAAMKFPESAGLVVPTLMDLLGDEHQSTAIEVPREERRDRRMMMATEWREIAISSARPMTVCWHRRSSSSCGRSSSPTRRSASPSSASYSLASP